MKKIVVILIVVLISSLLMGANKPPKKVELEIVNRAGENVGISLVGLGYDFHEEEFVSGWYGRHVHYLTVEGQKELPDGRILKLGEVYGSFTVYQDLYAIDVIYQSETEGGTGDVIVCDTNYLPKDYKGTPTITIKRSYNRLVIVPCERLPVNLGNPEEGYYKWVAYWMNVVK